VQDLTSYSCLATRISYKDDKILHLSRLVFETWCRTDQKKTDDRCNDHYRKLLHLQCASL